ncbi:class I SAM-dependent methyltransferase [Rhizobium sp. YIM 134829]|uniref:class I SAM-dependent methyltransferase n=1 Tax=Rhizobium sp. YIM 134829 TaxID=3390453 RepID=UPI00397E6FC1
MPLPFARSPATARFLVFAAVIAAQAAGAFLAHLLPFEHRMATLAAQGLVAAGLTAAFRLPRLWIPAQLLIPFVVAYGVHLPAWVFLVAFLLTLLISWNSAGEQVPLYLTNARTADALGQLAEAAGARKIVDLGSGLGSVVLPLARRGPHLFATGVETAPLPYAASRLRLALSGLANARLQRTSLWDVDLSAYDLVYCFLSPVPMPRLFEKARAEMRPGSLFVSNSFPVPDRTPDEVVTVADSRSTTLYVYRM